MGNVLLLYDTTEKDLARDFNDLLEELDLSVKMIPLSPDLGKTLQSKEEHYFNSVEGIVFLITPGSERKGKSFPSPSVADEMGQAKQKFKDKPEKIIYLVDNNCNVQAVDQKGYIQFDRKDIRSVIEAVVLLLKNLKEAELLGKRKIEHRETPGIKIAEYSTSIRDELKRVCFDLSDQPNGIMSISELDDLLKNKYKMSTRNINFVKGDIQKTGLVRYIQPEPPYFYSGWQLSNIGFELVRYELSMITQSRASGLLGLVDQINKPQYPTLQRGLRGLQPKEIPLGLKADLQKKS